MSRWGSFIRAGVAFVVSAFTSNWMLFASQLESERQRRKRDKANARARAAYNEAQKDRLEMLDLQPDAPRTLALGRVRYVEGVRDRWTSGTHSEKLTMIVSLAGHEIDAIESWYVDDVAVTLDGSGWVQESPWKVTRNEPAQNSGTADSGGGASITLSHTPVGGTATATWSIGTGDSSSSGTASVSVSGTTATVTGAAANSAVVVNYERSVATTYLRIRPYLGASGQNIGSALAAEYPGKITSTDRFNSIAAFVLDLVYSPDVFPQGPPNVTAVFRGAKCYDPRLDGTMPGGSGSHRIANPSTWAWSENPALLALRYAMWANGFNLQLDRGITLRTIADVQAAATQCDISTSFTLRMPDNSTTSPTLPRHRCGLVIPSDASPREAMDSIVDTMAGEWAFDGPELRLRAGMMASSAASIDQTWLVEPYTGDDDEAEPIVTATQAINRELRWNRVLGKCYDPAQRYQLLPYPAVSDTTLITSKGEKRGDLDLPGVNHVAHAQHLASIEIRRRQAGAVYVLQCDPRGELLQIFDVATLTIPDYGVSAKTFEVIGTDISMADAPVRLMLREITAAIYTVDAELRGVDPAPDSGLRAPWEVAQLGALTVTSGTAALLDNSVVARAQITWAAITGEWIRNGGDIEIQYTRADQALPSGEWASWTEPGTSTQATIPGLQAGRPYLFRGRMVQRMPLVRGAWSATTLHVMSTQSTNLGALGGGNMLANSDMEVDSNSDGVPDGWAAYSGGTTGTITNAVVTTGVGGGKRLRISASGLGTSSSDRAGVYQTVELAQLNGRPFAYTAHFSRNPTGVFDFQLYVDFRNAAGGGGSAVGALSRTIDDAPEAWDRYALLGNIPSGAVSANVFAWMCARNTSAGAAECSLDKLQFEIGAMPTAYAPRADELLAGSVGTTQLAASAATEVFTDSDTSDSVTGTSGTFEEMACNIFYDNTSASEVVVQFEAIMDGIYGDGAGLTEVGAFWRYDIDNGTPVTGTVFSNGGTNPTSTSKRQGVGIGQVSLPAGSDIDVELFGYVVAGGGGGTMYWSSAFLRVTIIKR